MGRGQERQTDKDSVRECEKEGESMKGLAGSEMSKGRKGKKNLAKMQVLRNYPESQGKAEKGLRTRQGMSDRQQQDDSCQLPALKPSFLDSLLP